MVGITEVRARLASAAALRCLCLASALATTAVSRLSASARRRPRLIALTARSAASSSTINRTIRTMSSTWQGIFRFVSREGSERPVKLLPSGFQNSTDAAKSDGRTRLPATMLAPAIVNAGARGGAPAPGPRLRGPPGGWGRRGGGGRGPAGGRGRGGPTPAHGHHFRYR